MFEVGAINEIIATSSVPLTSGGGGGTKLSPPSSPKGTTKSSSSPSLLATPPLTSSHRTLQSRMLRSVQPATASSHDESAFVAVSSGSVVPLPWLRGSCQLNPGFTFGDAVLLRVEHEVTVFERNFLRVGAMKTPARLKGEARLVFIVCVGTPGVQVSFRSAKPYENLQAATVYRRGVDLKDRDQKGMSSCHYQVNIPTQTGYSFYQRVVPCDQVFVEYTAHMAALHLSQSAAPGRAVAAAAQLQYAMAVAYGRAAGPAGPMLHAGVLYGPVNGPGGGGGGGGGGGIVSMAPPALLLPAHADSDAKGAAQLARYIDRLDRHLLMIAQLALAALPLLPHADSDVFPDGMARVILQLAMCDGMVVGRFSQHYSEVLSTAAMNLLLMERLPHESLGFRPALELDAYRKFAFRRQRLPPPPPLETLGTMSPAAAIATVLGIHKPRYSSGCWMVVPESDIFSEAAAESILSAPFFQGNGGVGDKGILAPPAAVGVGVGVGVLPPCAAPGGVGGGAATGSTRGSSSSLPSAQPAGGTVLPATTVAEWRGTVCTSSGLPIGTMQLQLAGSVLPAMGALLPPWETGTGVTASPLARPAGGTGPQLIDPLVGAATFDIPGPILNGSAAILVRGVADLGSGRVELAISGAALGSSTTHPPDQATMTTIGSLRAFVSSNDQWIIGRMLVAGREQLLVLLRRCDDVPTTDALYRFVVPGGPTGGVFTSAASMRNDDEAHPLGPVDTGAIKTACVFGHLGNLHMQVSGGAGQQYHDPGSDNTVVAALSATATTAAVTAGVGAAAAAASYGASSRTVALSLSRLHVLHDSVIALCRMLLVPRFMHHIVATMLAGGSSESVTRPLSRMLACTMLQCGVNGVAPPQHQSLAAALTSLVSQFVAMVALPAAAAPASSPVAIAIPAAATLPAAAGGGSEAGGHSRHVATQPMSLDMSILSTMPSAPAIITQLAGLFAHLGGAAAGNSVAVGNLALSASASLPKVMTFAQAPSSWPRTVLHQVVMLSTAALPGSDITAIEFAVALLPIVTAARPEILAEYFTAVVDRITDINHLVRFVEMVNGFCSAKVFSKIHTGAVSNMLMVLSKRLVAEFQMVMEALTATPPRGLLLLRSPSGGCSSSPPEADGVSPPLALPHNHLSSQRTAGGNAAALPPVWEPSWLRRLTMLMSVFLKAQLNIVYGCAICTDRAEGPSEHLMASGLIITLNVRKIVRDADHRVDARLAHEAATLAAAQTGGRLDASSSVSSSLSVSTGSGGSGGGAPHRFAPLLQSFLSDVRRVHERFWEITAVWCDMTHPLVPPDARYKMLAELALLTGSSCVHGTFGRVIETLRSLLACRDFFMLVKEMDDNLISNRGSSGNTFVPPRHSTSDPCLMNASTTSNDAEWSSSLVSPLVVVFGRADCPMIDAGRCLALWPLGRTDGITPPLLSPVASPPSVVGSVSATAPGGVAAPSPSHRITDDMSAAAAVNVPSHGSSDGPRRNAGAAAAAQQGTFPTVRGLLEPAGAAGRSAPVPPTAQWVANLAPGAQTDVVVVPGVQHHVLPPPAPSQGSASAVTKKAALATPLVGDGAAVAVAAMPTVLSAGAPSNGFSSATGGTIVPPQPPLHPDVLRNVLSGKHRAQVMRQLAQTRRCFKTVIGDLSRGVLRAGKVQSVRQATAPQRLYFEVVLPWSKLNSLVFSVGWGFAEHGSSAAHVGGDALSWGFNGNLVTHNGSPAAYMPAKMPLSAGTVIGCLLDLKEQRMAFSVEGVYGPPYDISGALAAHLASASAQRGGGAPPSSTSRATGGASSTEGAPSAAAAPPTARITSQPLMSPAAVPPSANTVRGAAVVSPSSAASAAAAPPLAWYAYVSVSTHPEGVTPIGDLPHYLYPSAGCSDLGGLTCPSVRHDVVQPLSSSHAGSEGGGGTSPSNYPHPSSPAQPTRATTVYGCDGIPGCHYSCGLLSRHSPFWATTPSYRAGQAVGPTAGDASPPEFVVATEAYQALNAAWRARKVTLLDVYRTTAAAISERKSSDAAAAKPTAANSTSTTAARGPSGTAAAAGSPSAAQGETTTDLAAQSSSMLHHSSATTDVLVRYDPLGEIEAHVRQLQLVLAHASALVATDPIVECHPDSAGAALRFLKAFVSPHWRRRKNDLSRMALFIVPATSGTTANVSADTVYTVDAGLPAPPGLLLVNSRLLPPTPTITLNWMTTHGDAARSIAEVLGASLLKQLDDATDGWPRGQWLRPPLFTVHLITSLSRNVPQDAGGPYRQVWSLLAEELTAEASSCYPFTSFHRNPLLVPSPNGVGFVPNIDDGSAGLKCPLTWRLLQCLGRIMAALAAANMPLAVDFSPFVWKYLVGDELTIDDYRSDVDANAGDAALNVDYLTHADVTDFFGCEFDANLQRVRAAWRQRDQAIREVETDAAAAAETGVGPAEPPQQPAAADPMVSPAAPAFVSLPPRFDASAQALSPALKPSSPEQRGLMSKNPSQVRFAPHSSTAPPPAAVTTPSVTAFDVLEDRVTPQSHLSGGGGSAAPFATGRSNSSRRRFAQRAEALIDVELRRQAAAHTLVHALDWPLQALRMGFEEVVPAAVVHQMTWKDLRTRVCGVVDPSYEYFKSFVRFSSTTVAAVAALPAGTPASHFQDMFNTAVEKHFTSSDRLKLVWFVTGQRRLPLSSPLVVAMSSEPVSYLPRAQSCSQTLYVPAYPTVDIMAQKLLQAIAHATQIELA